MPTRLMSLAIVICWTVAGFALVRRDLLPEIWIGEPPRLGATAADADAGPTRWSIQVVESRFVPGGKEERFRSVGTATTETKRADDGSLELLGRVSFDSGAITKATPFALGEGLRLVIDNSLSIDPSGRPERLNAVLREANSTEALLTVEGLFEEKSIRLKTSGPIPELRRTATIPYDPKSMVQNALSPIDRMPGLQVGQRWETKVVSPLTGKADVVRVEVERQADIYWDRGLVKTFVVVQKMPPIAARSWVRADGLVLRQELPLPLVKLLLERQP
ncbi:MAG: hypothetical protein SFX72_05635 [Isosphaeraceae bacterium]|nr:hypothetical protein [Isosphaeraceae bacterium]